MKFKSLVFAAALLVAPIAGMAQANQHRAGNEQAMQRAQVERGQRDMGADRMRDRDRLGAASRTGRTRRMLRSSRTTASTATT